MWIQPFPGYRYVESLPIMCFNRHIHRISFQIYNPYTYTLLVAYSYYTVTCFAFVYTSRHFLLRWFSCRPSITMLREHNAQACIGWIYASPSVLSSISEPALVRVANCRVCKCTVCSESSKINPRIFIIMRPTLCGAVRERMQLRKRTRVPQWKLRIALGWKDALSKYMCAWNVHLRRDVQRKRNINVWSYIQCQAC